MRENEERNPFGLPKEIFLYLINQPNVTLDTLKSLRLTAKNLNQLAQQVYWEKLYKKTFPEQDRKHIKDYKLAFLNEIDT